GVARQPGAQALEGRRGQLGELDARGAEDVGDERAGAAAGTEDGDPLVAPRTGAREQRPEIHQLVYIADLGDAELREHRGVDVRLAGDRGGVRDGRPRAVRR